MATTNGGVELTAIDLEAQQFNNEEEDEETFKERMASRTIVTRIVQTVALASLVLNVLAMVFNASIIVMIAGVLSVIIAIAVFKFQFDLQGTDTLRQVQNQLRRAVNEFARTNVGLTNNINKLGHEVSRLQVVENRLEDIATQQGKSVETLKSVVSESAKIIKEKTELTKADTMQAMMAAVIDSDFDETGQFSDKEIMRLTLRLRNLPAINVNEKLLRSKVQANRSLHSVFDLLQDIERADEDIPQDERIFSIKEEEDQ